MNQINETLFTAFDTIIKQRLDSISFDNTILCTIIEKLDNLKYMVRYGEASFIAYDVNNSGYEKDDQVYVIVPQGDYNQQKFILSKYITALTKVGGYSNPFDGFIKGSNNLGENTAMSFQANSNIQEFELLTETPLDNSYQGYSSIGVAADFKTYLLSQAVSGEYGIRINLYYTKEKSIYTITDEKPLDSYFIIYTDALPEEITTAEPLTDGRFRLSTSALTDEEWEIIKESNIKLYNLYNVIFDLSSKQMYGNPYYFEGYFNQQKVFPLPSDLLSVEYISCDFYQDNNFLDNKGNSIEATTKENIFIKDLEIYFGYLKEEYETNPIFLYSLGSKYYSNDEVTGEQPKRTIYFRYYKEDSNKDIVASPSESIAWLKNDEIISGKNEEMLEAELDTNQFQTSFSVKLDEKIISRTIVFTNLNSSSITVSDSLVIGNADNKDSGSIELNKNGSASFTAQKLDENSPSNKIEINAADGTITFKPSDGASTVITFLNGDIAIGTTKITDAAQGILAQLQLKQNKS